MTDLARSRLNEIFSPDHRKQRIENAPWVRDTFSWLRKEKADMVHAACWYTMANRIPGDFLEFGVWEGLTIVEAYYAIRQLSLGMKLHAFDSFEGLPAPRPEDNDTLLAKGMFYTPQQVFESNLDAAGVDRSRVTTTPGFFETSLTPDRAAAIGLKQAAVTWIDCDLYHSTVSVLSFVEPLLSDGGIVIFDDWFAYCGRPDRGERAACEEWLARNPSISLLPYRTFQAAGQSFIVHRKRASPAR